MAGRALAWISLGLGAIQIFVGGANPLVLAPGFLTLLLFALPKWLQQESQVNAPRDSAAPPSSRD